ncbi:unnamed protein product [Adineta steineri]|uniref:NmrA-like domain-containing protein n=1 Tax=Adineta steineri TaxID=433720 RepID=A0A813PCX7_9BILA|nr:unnamed protein product [Adineta steineri]CAF0748603.1 unnamed protein product [Adineta steineri]CAF1358861.1 unnamed protein product [Adineta steineri]CAF1599581.1 unnamed protein product [Adineta steineri]
MSSSSPSCILVIGATGNTGSSVVKHLSDLITLLPSTIDQPRHIIALTRNAKKPTAIELSKLDHVEVQELDLSSVDSSWLIAKNVVRVYVATPNQTSQFVDESQFLLVCKEAKTIQYLVKLSTNPHFITADHPIYYGRIHWALERMLEEKEFKEQVNWTILRANVFATGLLSPSIEMWKKDKDKPMALLLDEHSPLALVHPADVGAVAAKLLSLTDPSPHFHKTYTISGPEDVTGKDIISYVEEIVQKKIDVEYKNEKVFKTVMESDKYPENVWKSMEKGHKKNLWTGQSRLANTKTSDEVVRLAAPHSTVKQTIQHALQGYLSF